MPSAVRRTSLRIDPGEARELIASGAYVVDVRRKDDPARTLRGAVRIAPDEIPGRLAALPADTPIVLACT